MERIRAHFAMAYPHINFQGIEESVIREYMARPYLDGLGFFMQMNCLYDYILSQDLCEVDE
jgi:hypothetical protein